MRTNPPTPDLTQTAGPQGRGSRAGVQVQWRGGGAYGWGSAVYAPEERPGVGTVTGGVACARGLTVNESEGPQEHDPGQPEGARAEAGRAVRGVSPWSRRRPRSLARARNLPPPERLFGRRHCRAIQGACAEIVARETPAYSRAAPPTPPGPAHNQEDTPLCGEHVPGSSARAPPADRAGYCNSAGKEVGTWEDCEPRSSWKGLTHSIHSFTHSSANVEEGPGAFLDLGTCPHGPSL